MIFLLTDLRILVLFLPRIFPFVLRILDEVDAFDCCGLVVIVILFI